MSDEDKQPLKLIVSQQLTAVIFLMDYVKFQFEYPVLTALSFPVVIAGGVKFGSGMPGYRDALCEQITKVVEDAHVIEGEEIRIIFADGTIFSVSLKSGGSLGGEFAFFEIPPDKMWIWREE